jgi:hypothetical protein
VSGEIKQLLDRIDKLERDVVALKANSVRDQPWWERIAGRFENDPTFDEIVRLGREYRESQRPKDE